MTYIKKFLSQEQHAGPALYQPLSPERLAALQAAIPAQDKRLDLGVINARIAKVWFNKLTTEDGEGRSFACTIQLDNGFETHGVSSVLFAENYNEELGLHYAYKKAFAELIPIASFLQREAAWNPRPDLG